MTSSVLADSWVLKLKNSDSLYYGDLSHPFFVFDNQIDAEEYARSHCLGRMFHAIRATPDMLQRYLNCSF